MGDKVIFVIYRILGRGRAAPGKGILDASQREGAINFERVAKGGGKKFQTWPIFNSLKFYVFLVFYGFLGIF